MKKLLTLTLFSITCIAVKCQVDSFLIPFHPYCLYGVKSICEVNYHTGDTIVKVAYLVKTYYGRLEYGKAYPECNVVVHIKEINGKLKDFSEMIWKKEDSLFINNLKDIYTW